MVKIAVLGDFHLGYGRFYDDSFTQAKTALMSAQERADLLIIAGDIFDSRVPKPEVIERAFEVFSKVRKKVFVIHGTHERRPKGFTTPVDLLCKAGFAESCHNNPLVFEKDGRRVRVVGIGGVPEEYASAAMQKLSPKPIEGMFNVLVFHQNIKELMPMVKDGISMEDLPEGFDLYIDGHLHKNYELRKGEKLLIIPGSTVITQLRKEESKKGYYLFDTETKTVEFVEINARPFIHVSIEPKADIDIKQTVKEKLSEIDFSAKPIIRLDIINNTGNDISHEDMNYIKAMYSEKAHLFINASSHEADLSPEEIGVQVKTESIRERGIAILKQIATSKNLAFKNVEEVFDMSCEASDDELFDYFKRIYSNRSDGG